MVVNTENCSYSEMKIWPGRGSRFVARDGKISFFIGSKARGLFKQKIKAVKLTWTQAWRRHNKKIKVDETQKRRTKRTTRVQKAIVGISLDEIKRRRNEKENERDKKMEDAKKDVKQRQKQKQDAKKQDKSKVKAPAASKKVEKPKVDKGGKGGKKGGR